MADVSYSKNVVRKPAAAEPTVTSSQRWLPGRERWLGIATIVAFLVIWEGVYRLGLMPKWAFPSPWQVILAFQELISNGKLLTNTAASIGRQITGVLLAALVGIPAGLVLGASPTARAAFLPLCRLLYPIPGIAWIPLAILWFGVGFTSTVFVIFFSGIWSIMFNTMTGVQTLSGQYTDVAKVYLASRSLYTRRILIPGSLPYMITGMRLTYGVGWRVIVGAEMISSITGLGFLIDDARWQLRPDIMICGMITIAMIGWVSENWLFDWIEEKSIVRWGMRTT
jgi:ABC-type nitrate/sulfonate/bicarbonate transport system permease component